MQVLVMGLKELRKEILSLPEIGRDLKGFKQHWVKPLRKGQSHNKVQSELHNLGHQEKSKINSSLKNFYSEFKSLESHSIFTEKLQGLSHAMIDMKLLGLRGAESSSKMKFLQSTLMEDPRLGISSVISEIKIFDQKLSQVENMYHDINGYLHQTLSLEHSVALLDLPHYAYLKNLKETAKHQKRIVKKLGNEFVSIQRKLQVQKKKQKRASD